MKRTLLLFFFITSVVFISCNNTNTSTENNLSDSTKQVSGAAITFDKTSYDFGKVQAGEKVTHEFKFTNNGTEPLIISEARASCGCTVPEYPKEPVSPGKSGVIKVIFDSKGRQGVQNKIVTVTSNANPSLTEIYLTGEVTAK